MSEVKNEMRKNVSANGPWSKQCSEFARAHKLGVINMVGSKRYRFNDRTNGYELPHYVSNHRTLLGVMQRYIEGNRATIDVHQQEKGR